jgi:glycosyltransferase involved in cell wall biosynthesis
MKKICLTVTNDLTYDQRMQRIARSLQLAGYQVTLVGRLLPDSSPCQGEIFQQVRLKCHFNKGFLFYAEYNLRLMIWLFRADFDAIGTVDLDTLVAGGIVGVFRRKVRVFDAHEYFTEVPEVVNRRFVKAFWGVIARLFLPFYHYAYTVGPALASIFTKKYHIPFEVVRNVPQSTATIPADILVDSPRILLYQGALNEGRGIEAMLHAMQELPDFQFWLAGEGDLSAQLRAMAKDLGVSDRVRFLGYVKPAALKDYTQQAWAGLNLLENRGLSYYYSLANKFFDNVQAVKPVLTMDFPEYRALNAEYEVAILLTDLKVETLVQQIRYLATDPNLYNKLKTNCLQARKHWIWENDEKILLGVWEKAFEQP